MKTTSATKTEKPKLLFQITANIIAAISTQILLTALLYGLVKEIPQKASMTIESAHGLAITALLIACGCTTLCIVVSTYLFERSAFFDENNLQDREISRAVYFAVIGMIGVCATRAFEANRVLPAFILLVIIGLLLVLGRYQLKFREARQGIWFPHATLQYVVQEFALFPAGLWITTQILNRS